MSKSGRVGGWTKWGKGRRTSEVGHSEEGRGGGWCWEKGKALVVVEGDAARRYNDRGHLCGQGISCNKIGTATYPFFKPRVINRQAHTSATASQLELAPNDDHPLASLDPSSPGSSIMGVLYNTIALSSFTSTVIGLYLLFSGPSPPPAIRSARLITRAYAWLVPRLPPSLFLLQVRVKVSSVPPACSPVSLCSST